MPDTKIGDIGAAQSRGEYIKWVQGKRGLSASNIVSTFIPFPIVVSLVFRFGKRGILLNVIKITILYDFQV